MSVSPADLRARIREKLLGISNQPITETEIITALNGKESRIRKSVTECARCGQTFKNKTRHLIHIYHQRKSQKWEVIAQERLYICPGCLVSIQAFIQGEW